ncbi:RNase adapter RapZ [Amnimonas aquatica]|uniref:RNase adapter RapZ n=1 Tax=Amnimonas aquatica TaxID=2094561 RepID=A0A2P6AV86_9GAMM|nr:RNase adapter RapZ [Amnimonas aquatica]PQA52116.1 RNase adapter RapZ [Amnimonas aquatica]
MKLVIVSGRSGSGKSTALHQLEDLGYYCVDNLPVALLPELVNTFRSGIEGEPTRLAVGIDARNRVHDLSRYADIARILKEQGCDPEIVYLDARDDMLMARFSSTRRKHPLSSNQRSLEEAIAYERELLDQLASHADLRLDTSSLSVHDLREALRQRFEPDGERTSMVLIESFAFKHGVPLDADLVFDVRCLPNPHWETGLRDMTGLDQPVIEFLDEQPLVEALYLDIYSFLLRWLPELQASDRTYVTVAIGCTGGQHRSVYMVERLSAALHETLGQLQTRHRELHRKGRL